MNINIYNPYVRSELELYHHGIRGQRWGKRNGPPYPLGAGDHSASEKKAGWRKSLSDKRDEKKQIKYYKKDLVNNSISEKYWKRATAAKRLGNDKKYDKNMSKSLKYAKKSFDAAEKMRAIENKRGLLSGEQYTDLEKKYKHIEQDKEKKFVNDVYERANRKNRPLTEKEIRKLHEAYVSRMTDDEVKKVVDWAKKHDQLEKEAALSWEKYEKEFNSDPKRRKITEKWTGDGTELYREMQKVMPNKKDQAIQDKELEMYFKGEKLARDIANRITKGDKEYKERGVFTRKGYRSISSNFGEALWAVNGIEGNVKQILSYGKNEDPKKIAKALGLSESYVRSVLSSK